MVGVSVEIREGLFTRRVRITTSGDSEDDSCRNGAVEIRPGKGSATNGGTCYEGLTTQGI